MNPLSLLLLVLLPALASMPQDQVKSPPGDLRAKPTMATDQPPARDTLRRVGTELLSSTRGNAQSRAIALGWLDSLPDRSPSLSDRLAEFNEIAIWKAYLNARFEAEFLTARFVGPLVTEAASTVPANWDHACELKISIEGVLDLPPSQAEGCRDLDPLFRLGPAHRSPRSSTPRTPSPAPRSPRRSCTAGDARTSRPGFWIRPRRILTSRPHW
jgi:hypothetical protein